MCPLPWAPLEKAERDWVLAHLAPVVQKVDSAIRRINNNYSPKWRWVVVDIYWGREAAR